MRLLLQVGMILCLSSCWNYNNWTEEEREQFRNYCLAKTEFKPFPISFEGFDSLSIDTVMIYEVKNEIPIDTFFIMPKRDPHRKEEFWASTERLFQLNCSYIFVIDTSEFILSNMQMSMSPQYTMLSEGWGCIMNKFAINDSVMNQGNICIKNIRY
ncbi:MAG: hypothetical protein MRY83_07545 [Flavobacteriales bacterium]|nr:hypothetical protein [Flavobacteriales bacterium]